MRIHQCLLLNYIYLEPRLVILFGVTKSHIQIKALDGQKTRNPTMGFPHKKKKKNFTGTDLSLFWCQDWSFSLLSQSLFCRALFLLFNWRHICKDTIIKV